MTAYFFYVPVISNNITSNESSVSKNTVHNIFNLMSYSERLVSAFKEISVCIQLNMANIAYINFI